MRKILACRLNAQVGSKLSGRIQQIKKKLQAIYLMLPVFIQPTFPRFKPGADDRSSGHCCGKFFNRPAKLNITKTNSTKVLEQTLHISRVIFFSFVVSI